VFDISFGELLLIGVVALVVLGPERLPTVARTVGALIARLQRFVSSVKTDIQRETNLSGLTELRSDIQDAAQTFQRHIETELADVKASTDGLRSEFTMAAQSAEQALAEVKDSVSADAQAVALPAKSNELAPSPATTTALIEPSAYVPPSSAVPSTPPATPPASASHS
jgi:sec-independent protein translocase protein TatB